jgi:hypothetical protein
MAAPAEKWRCATMATGRVVAITAAQLVRD